jgi:hypothetical protein
MDFGYGQKGSRLGGGDGDGWMDGYDYFTTLLA